MKTNIHSKLLTWLLVLTMVLALVPTVAFAADAAAYTAITSVDELVTGQYVMVLDNGYAPTVLNGSWVDSNQPTITATGITGPEWTLTVSEAGVQLTDANDVSIAPNGGNSNGIKSGAYNWTVTCTDGKFKFTGAGSDTVTLACNNSSGHRFRAYKNATVNGNSSSSYPCSFSLYKLNATPTELKEFGIVGEWIHGSTIADAGVNGAEKIVSRCAEMGVTDIYLLVKGTGGTIGWLNTEFTDNLTRENRDVLQETIDACRAHGLRIHAWICNMEDSAYKAAHPEAGMWHYVRERDNDRVNPYDEGYQEYMSKIVKELATYDIDGLHLDYIRYNHICNGWSETDFANLEAMGANIDNVKYLIEKTFYADKLPEGEAVDSNYIFAQYAAGDADAKLIAEYRRNNVQAYADKIITAAKEVKPDLIISAALQPETSYDEAFGGLHYGNKFSDFAEDFDYVCPMAYSNVFGKDAAWMVKVAKAAIDQGTKVVMGLNSYYGANGVTSKLLMDDIEAVRGLMDDETYGAGVLGIIHFRNSQFGYAKVSYDLDDENMQIKTINTNTSNGYQWVIVELQDGLTAKAATLGEGYSSDTSIEIGEDGSYVKFYGTDILGADSEGVLNVTYEGDLDVSKPAALVRIYITNESRAYNIYVNATEEDTAKDGIVAENGALYYYKNGERQFNCGLIEVNGDYYYVRSNGQVATGTYWVSNTNDVVAPGYCQFGADGRLVSQKNGVVSENGALYYYVNGDLGYGAGLIELDGSYYYVRSNGQVVVGDYWITKTNDLMEAGFYTFGADGKLEAQKNGIVSENDGLYYYVDGEIQYCAGLIELDGSFYYIRSNGQAAVGAYWVTNTNGLKEAGFYTFGADGKMIVE